MEKARVALVVLLGAIAITLLSSPARAITPGWALPLRSAVMTPSQNGNLVNGYCHDIPCTPGTDKHNYWAIDLFDYSTDAPVYATKAGKVQTVNACQTAVRIGNVLSGYGFGYLYCHGEDRVVNVNANVATGQKIMEVGNPNLQYPVHLHYEIRFMDNVTQWSTNFIGYCANYNLLQVIANQTAVLRLAWKEPDNTLYSDCSW